MALLFMVLMAIFAGWGAIIDFGWFGTAGTHVAGFICLALLCLALASIVPGALAYQRRPPPPAA